MKKMLSLAALMLFSTSALLAQQALNNASIIKMSKAGLSANVILATINASPGNYDTTPDSMIALKNAGVPDQIIAALVKKGEATAENGPCMERVASRAEAVEESKPHVYLSAQNSANTWGALLHNQSEEMSKDFGESCPGVVVTVDRQNADYTVSLNHVEAGFYRDNQLYVADRDGNVIAPPVKHESIAKGVKRACAAITSDWAAKYSPEPPAPVSVSQPTK